MAPTHTISITFGQCFSRSDVIPLLDPCALRWKPFDPSRNWPDLGPKFLAGERAARAAAIPDADPEEWVDRVVDDRRDLDWATVLKRTFEAYVRGERPNMYGEWLQW